MIQPSHVGIIMDGNGRWATARGLPRYEGHREGLKTLKKTVETAINRGLKHLSLFTFSTENFFRPKEEVDFLMFLFRQAFKDYIGEAIEKGIRVKIVGNTKLLPNDIQDLCDEAVQKTKHNSQITVYFAIAYGGRREILDAIEKILQTAKPEAITEEWFKSFLYCPDMPDVDLLIRTGQEFRISNFLLWHLAYSEIYFCDKFWPDFTEVDFTLAMEFFYSRQRRFGRTPEQAGNKFEITKCNNIINSNLQSETA
ncbi:MAG: polyprenyl diphosphate synthase [Deltaproteobacteria bacterium]|nr:polyprenyl diphosphate synthase [Deltaproteobacteria bacterium]